MSQTRLEVRQSQVIYQAAVGALVQIGGTSLVPCDIRFWGNDGEEVFMPRLSRLFGGLSFRKAPVLATHGGREVGGRIPAVRFPKAMYCRKCRHVYLDPGGDVRPGDSLVCASPDCMKSQMTLSPMPWVMICANGHMGDLPWKMLVHREAKGPKQITCGAFDKMRFLQADSKGNKAKIVCEACGASLGLGALRGKMFLEGVKCPGRQPWLLEETDCEAKAGKDGTLIVAGLGDYFVHYPVVLSALDIPPESRLNPRDDIGRRLRQDPGWRELQELYLAHGPQNVVVANRIAAMAMHLNCPSDVIQGYLLPARVEADPVPDGIAPIAKGHALRREEYQAFLKRITDYREYERFITLSKTDEWRNLLRSDDLGQRLKSMGGLIDELVGAPLLREVRALQGFTRIHPFGANNTRLVPADLAGESTWLPVAEFYGEGVFFTLDRYALAKWNDLPGVQKRTARVRKKFEASPLGGGIDCSEERVPSFILLHTLAHMMIREMAFMCGYPAASLRERLFFGVEGEGMAGVLIYLAAGEPGGSLGGIAKLADPSRFMSLLARCVEAAEWCALDPVCGEHEGRGEDGLNRAACHACCLLPETSCECGNLLLDRNLIVSGPSEAGCGLFDVAEGS